MEAFLTSVLSSGDTPFIPLSLADACRVSLQMAFPPWSFGALGFPLVLSALADKTFMTQPLLHTATGCLCDGVSADAALSPGPVGKPVWRNTLGHEKDLEVQRALCCGICASRFCKSILCLALVEIWGYGVLSHRTPPRRKSFSAGRGCAHRSCISDKD